MRIALTSDTHLNITTKGQLKVMFKAMAEEQFDVLVHAGDYCGASMGHKSVHPTLELMRQFMPDKPMVSVIGNHECISMDTEILTQEGWKKYNSVKKTDLVATMNENRELEWQSINAIFKRPVRQDEKMFRSEGRIAIDITENHRVYCYDRFSGKINVKKAVDCPSEFNVISAIKSTTSVSLSDNEIKLAAWLCTDSHFDKKTDRIVIYQRESNAEHVHEILKAGHIDYTHKTRARDIKQICGKVLKEKPEASVEFYISADQGRKIKYVLGTTKNTALPSWAREMSDLQWGIFLKELIEADGSVTKGDALVFYGKKQICEDVQICASLHGWSASITEYRLGQFRVNLSPKSTIRVMALKEYQPSTDTEVWCINVDNGNFMCRLDNKVHITGNCWCATGTGIPTREAFDNNKAKIRESFAQYNVHHLDYDGIYVHPEHSTVKVMGATGWYHNPKPPTNDEDRMPRSPTGSIHYELSRYYHDVFEKNLKLLDEQFDKAVDTLVFVSHFPVMAQKENDKKFDQFGGNPMIAELLRNDYGCKYFLNGHSHLFANGTNGQYVCGADYYNPKYLIIEVN